MIFVPYFFVYGYVFYYNNMQVKQQVITGILIFKTFYSFVLYSANVLSYLILKSKEGISSFHTRPVVEADKPLISVRTRSKQTIQQLILNF